MAQSSIKVIKNLKQDLRSETSWIVLIVNLIRISLVKNCFAKVQSKDVNWCTFPKFGARTCFRNEEVHYYDVIFPVKFSVNLLLCFLVSKTCQCTKLSEDAPLISRSRWVLWQKSFWALIINEIYFWLNKTCRHS